MVKNEENFTNVWTGDDVTRIYMSAYANQFEVQIKIVKPVHQ